MDLPTDPLDELENPVQPSIVPEMDMYADPLCRALDGLESSIEDQQALSSPIFDSLGAMLDNLEKETEQQGNLPPVSEQVLPTHDLINSEAGDHSFQGGGRVSGSKSTPPTPDLEETPTAKQYSMPIPRMRGHSGSSSRNTRDDDGYYCYLHRAWVLLENCEDCPDFEEDEYASEDEDEKRCKHSIFRLSEDSDG